MKPAFSADDIFLWWHEKAGEIIEKTKIDNGVTPDQDAFTLDLIALCQQVLSGIKTHEAKDTLKQKIKQQEKVQKSLATIVEYFSAEHRRNGLKTLAESEGIAIEPRDLMRILSTLNNVFASLQAEPHKKRLKPETWLITKGLPGLYRKHFKKELGVSRPPGSGEPYGPGVRFIFACLEVLGLEKSPEAIVRMISRHKA